MTTLAEIGQSVVKFAPLLGGVLGGPAGAALGTILAGKFGGSPNDLDDLSNRIAADPESEIKLRQIESDNQVQLQNLVVSAENNRLQAETAQLKIQADNLADARAMKTKTVDEATKIYLVIFTSSLIFGCLYAVLMLNVNNNLMSIITLILGYALNEMKNYNAFYYGSSVGSKQKDETIANAVRH